tara:strand:- start:76 stop:741 length:666 start_codon:yes stop_codon:yes gene_type:complete
LFKGSPHLESNEKSIIESFVHDFKGELRDLKLNLEKDNNVEGSILFQIEMMNEMLLAVEEYYFFYHMELKKKSVNLPLLVKSCFQKVKERNQNRTVEFNIILNNFKKSNESDLIGDDDSIKKALSLLIENAWKFTKDVPNATITFGEEDIKGEHFFYLYNNGPNLPHEVNIFDLFYGKRSGHERAGLGIGLPLAKLIFEKHGGRLWAKNNDEGGVTFYFKF